MYDELTKVDIEKMQAEIDHRITVIRPALLEDVKTARAFGDLSENFEYKVAKQEKNRNESRIRYLQNMIKTAKVIEVHSQADCVGLFDTVELYFEQEDENQTMRIVTALRQDALNNLISKESPLGNALMGHKVGDRVTVKVNDQYSYPVIIKNLHKGEDDSSLSISSY